MTFQLEYLDAKAHLRPIAIKAGKPRVFKVVKQGRDAGAVSVELHEDTCTVTNRSQRPVLVNGVECDHAALAENDVVVIGKDSFRVKRADATGETVRIGAGHGSGNDSPKVAHLATTCTACDGPFEAELGLAEGAKRICATCLDQRGTAKHVAQSTPTGAELTAESEPEVVEPATSGRAHSDSDLHRRRKSISASMRSAVDQPRKTMLNRVTSVFSPKARHSRSHEESLQQERRQVLEEAGRQVLAAHALGLPEQAFSDLLAGRTVTIRPEEIARAALERWRELAERVALLDAEISAERLSLGLGPDLGAVRLTAPRARDDIKQHEARVFATLDAWTTQELAPDAESPPAKAGESALESGELLRKKSVSGRSRSVGRRRHE